MFKDLSAKYYQDNKERLQKKLVKGIKVFLKKKKKKSNNMVMNDTRIYQKMKKMLVKCRKMISLSNEKKHLIIIIRNYFSFRKFVFFLGLG